MEYTIDHKVSITLVLTHDELAMLWQLYREGAGLPSMEHNRGWSLTDRTEMDAHLNNAFVKSRVNNY